MIIWMVFYTTFSDIKPYWRYSEARVLFDPSQLCLIEPWDLIPSKSNTYSAHANMPTVGSETNWKSMGIFVDLNQWKWKECLLLLLETTTCRFLFYLETSTMEFPSKVSCFNLIKCQFTGNKQDTIKVSNFLDINIPMLSYKSKNCV